MNLYIVIFFMCVGGFYCDPTGQAKPGIEFFTDVKQAVEYKDELEKNAEDFPINWAPRIFRIVPYKENECDMSTGRLAHYRCLVELKYAFRIYELDVIPYQPMPRYNIIESTITIKENDDE